VRNIARAQLRQRAQLVEHKFFERIVGFVSHKLSERMPAGYSVNWITVFSA
jgi:hypothetical protein